MKIPVRVLRDEKGREVEVAIPYEIYESKVRPIVETMADDETLPTMMPVDLSFLTEIREDLKHLKGLNLSGYVEEDREDRI